MIVSFNEANISPMVVPWTMTSVNTSSIQNNFRGDMARHMPTSIPTPARQVATSAMSGAARDSSRTGRAPP